MCGHWEISHAAVDGSHTQTHMASTTWTWLVTKIRVGWRLCLWGELEDGNRGVDMTMFYGVRKKKKAKTPTCQNKTS